MRVCVCVCVCVPLLCSSPVFLCLCFGPLLEGMSEGPLFVVLPLLELPVVLLPSHHCHPIPGCLCVLRRDSQAELLLGADGWVEHKESGVAFRLDVTLCMFSSGNVTERTRMGRLLEAAGETVVDLFCGIGYYTLPLLARAGVSKVTRPLM